MNDYFPADYFAARDAFCACARGVDAEPDNYNIVATGPIGEPLSINSAYLGSPLPRQLVLITSGIHGVEGYAGSALQQLWLTEFAQILPADTGVLLVHALNPYGFAFNRRANEHNVDLNRNALATFPGPVNPAYRSLNAWLNPGNPAPRFDDFAWRALPHLLRYGRSTLTQAIAAGQYEYPLGLFYGGCERETSLAFFAELLAAPRFANVRRIWHLDLHSGLGRFGHYQLLIEEPPATRVFEHFYRGFGAQAVKSNHASNTTHYSAHGILSMLTHHAFPNSQIYATTVEFGTYSPAKLLRILRAENRAHHNGTQRSGDAARIRKQLRDALAPRDPAWQTAVIAGGRQIFTQLRTLLAEPAHG